MTYNQEKAVNNLIIVCAGGCGRTTEDINPYEFWRGEVKESTDPSNLVPKWTCRECVDKRRKEEEK
jgi:hypothetical protein